MRSIASGAARQAMARGAFIRRRGSIVMVPAAISAFGAARLRRVRGAFTRPPADMKSEERALIYLI